MWSKSALRLLILIHPYQFCDQETQHGWSKVWTKADSNQWLLTHVSIEQYRINPAINLSYNPKDQDIF